MRTSSSPAASNSAIHPSSSFGMPHPNLHAGTLPFGTTCDRSDSTYGFWVQVTSRMLARDVEASAICPNSTDMRDGLMRIMRVGLSDAGYLTRTYLKIADRCRSDINVE